MILVKRLRIMVVVMKALYLILLGVAGSGKIFTVANVIARVNKPTLILAYNKTLAGQLYEELKQILPENYVCYFIVSMLGSMKSLFSIPFNVV